MKLILSLGFLALAIWLSAQTMIIGWGLQPQNWGWIIGGNVAVMAIAGLSGALAKSSERD